MRVLILSADGFEDSELLCPMYRLKEADYQVDIAAPEWGQIKGKRGYTVTANLALDDVETDGFRLLLLPGGKEASQTLRTIPLAQDIVRSFADKGLPVAAICHGPQILVSAGILVGRRATCCKTVAGELEAIGAIYEDSEVVVDGNIITSRQPSDIPMFMKAVLEALAV
ncbi:MAG: type 1 glutamine amidotransferase [Deltaproteobacteria bacterium]|nr:type 1 glutamine amidotransferase [Deltaproteobacteria bacterium]RKX59132.1 MAG: type 1 glutamine amidotransferase [Thermodesulfobacteriota bacterium]MBW1946465.1 type 1 glutamine amidotransferase [Deltaproteobacteria bacterium]MBW1966159.1 type 1 glutamine amidotransferase [Deltaproteobacteria bacterium]MBW2097478.1 type 1 glutamine amidotransferase [Deltaproteobacteria bacterium]